MFLLLSGCGRILFCLGGLLLPFAVVSIVVPRALAFCRRKHREHMMRRAQCAERCRQWRARRQARSMPRVYVHPGFAFECNSRSSSNNLNNMNNNNNNMNNNKPFKYQAELAQVLRRGFAPNRVNLYNKASLDY